MTDPWERQRGESRQAFEAFTRYRDLGGTRSVVRVARELAKSRTLVSRWSARWGWVSRVEAWDREQDRAWRQEQQQARIDTSRRQLRVANLALAKAVERIQAVRPEDLSPMEAMRWVQAAAELERRAVGADDEDRDAGVVREAGWLVTEFFKALRGETTT